MSFFFLTFFMNIPWWKYKFAWISCYIHIFYKLVDCGLFNCSGQMRWRYFINGVGAMIVSHQHLLNFLGLTSSLNCNRRQLLPFLYREPKSCEILMFVCNRLIMKSMKLVIQLHFIWWVNSFSDISRKCILPNMIATPIIFGKMHFLLISENEFFHEIKCKRMTAPIIFGNFQFQLISEN